MKHYLKWKANVKGSDDVFEASVPGNIQSDYAKSHDYPDLQYSDNYKQYKWMEDVSWVYSTEFDNPTKDNECLYFVSLGIDYKYKIIINNTVLLENEGMYSKTELDLTPYLKAKNTLEVEIYPVPKSPLAAYEDRDQANQSVKPAVCYGWDWHPRLVPSGMWQEAYIETRGQEYISYCEPFYTLSDDLKTASLSFKSNCNPKISLYSPADVLIYEGDGHNITVESIKLWWCNGYGEQSLYKWVAQTADDTKEGYIGFRKVRLIMNDGQWDIPAVFPKSRSNPPITIELNGLPIFAKGTNWVNPEIFVGEITDEIYETQIIYAKEAHMNMFRVHGGTIINKKHFYDCCDKYGIMVWQEFTLACNNYVATPQYMKTLEKEAVSIIKDLRTHPCHVLWCGGNELFNNWSGMTDQSHALRLLNKLCYEHDYEKPFIMTSPLMGMAHGHYLFYDKTTGIDLMQLMNSAENTAYTEFGVPSLAPIETLKRIIPEDEWYPIKPDTAWQEHCGFYAWGEEAWICEDVLEHYFGKLGSVEEYVEYSNLLQCEGYKVIFGEARRQWPRCSMALNWDYNEPWMNAAGNNLLAYPSERKPAYYAVKEILRPVLATARAKRFDYNVGDDFSAGLYYHNDTADVVTDTVYAFAEINGEEFNLCTWDVKVEPYNNVKGPECHLVLPEVNGNTIFKLILKTDKCNGYEQRFLLYGTKEITDNRFLNV